MYKFILYIGFVLCLFIYTGMEAQMCTCLNGVCFSPPNCSCCPGAQSTNPSTADRAKSLKDQAGKFIEEGNCNDKCKDEFDKMKVAKDCVEKTEKCKTDTEDYEKKQKSCDAAKETTKSACNDPGSTACANARKDEQEKCDAAEKAKTTANDSCKVAKDTCKDCGVEGLDGKDGKPPTSSDVGKAYDQAVGNLNSKVGSYKGCCFAATGKGSFCGVVPPKYSTPQDTDPMFLIVIFSPALALLLLNLLIYKKVKQT